MARTAYSLICANGVVAAIEEGLSTHQAAARFSIGVSTAGPGASAETLARRRSTRPARCVPKGSVLDVHADFILGVLEDKPGHDSRRAGRPACCRARCQDRQDGSLEVSRPARPDAQKRRHTQANRSPWM